MQLEMVPEGIHAGPPQGGSASSQPGEARRNSGKDFRAWVASTMHIR